MKKISWNRAAAIALPVIVIAFCAACGFGGAGNKESGAMAAETGMEAETEMTAEMNTEAAKTETAETPEKHLTEAAAETAEAGTEMAAADGTEPAAADGTEPATAEPAGAEDAALAAESESADAATEDAEGGTAHMCVMAYNIYYKETERRKDNVFDVIARNDPDVLLLQEFSQDWLKYLPELLEDGYSCYGYGRRGTDILKTKDDQRDEFTPVLWKTDRYDLVDSGYFYLSSTPEVPSSTWTDGDRVITSKYVRCANWVILRDRDTGSEIFLLPIHLAPESGQVRPNGCRFLLEKVEELRDGRPAVIGGDYNVGPWDTCYTILTEGGFTDTRHAADETTDSGTFNNFGKYLSYCDYIFTAGDVKVESFAVPDDMYDGMHASDHCPVRVEIRFGGEK